MLEAALVFDLQGRLLCWHEPAGRSSGSIPDSRALWEILWEHRGRLGGVAHTHPWKGSSSPSATDTSTFRAVEAGLGIRLIWPVVTFTEVGIYEYDETQDAYVQWAPPFANETHWLDRLEELRQRSQTGASND